MKALVFVSSTMPKAIVPIMWNTIITPLRLSSISDTFPSMGEPIAIPINIKITAVIKELEAKKVWKLLESCKQEYMTKKNVMGFYYVARII